MLKKYFMPVKMMLALAIIGIMLCTGCKSTDDNVVVVYTSVDQVYAEPILKKFEEKTGVRILPVFDVEASKTTGLVNRLIAEKEQPQADVFWNSEFMQTILLQEKGVLAQYMSEAAKEIMPQYLDKDGYWSGFGGRIRVILVNTKLLKPEDYPRSVFALLGSALPEKTALAQPMFGTTATFAAALYAKLGRDAARTFFADVKKRGVQVVDGNSVVRDMVADGQLYWGLTDSDDADGAVKKGAPVAIVIPDQDDMGTLFIPNTVALIAKAPHSENGKKLIDFLLSDEVEKEMLASGAIQFSARINSENVEYNGIKNKDIKRMDVSFADIYKELAAAKEDLTQIFIQ